MVDKAPATRPDPPLPVGNGSYGVLNPAAFMNSRNKYDSSPRLSTLTVQMPASQAMRCQRGFFSLVLFISGTPDPA